MKHIAAAVTMLVVLCSSPAQALSVPDYSPADMRAMTASARAGDVDAMIDLGRAHAWGRSPGNGTDHASAIYWLHKAANLGSAEAQRLLGDVYDAPDHPDDEPRAFLWYLRAAEKGDVFAQGRLARLYETSKTRSDYGKGYQWTLKAALQGDDNAVIRLQTLYIYKNEVATFDAAQEKLSATADIGDTGAQWRLASILLMGLVGHKDEARARVLAEKAAVRNSPEGYYLMSFFVPSGDDVPTETRIAARMVWLRKAADLGHVPAQLDWMLFYESPFSLADTAQDPNERIIFDWVSSAAEKGWPMAQEVYSHYHHRGLFVAKDAVEGHKWLMLARHLPYHRNGPWGNNPDLWKQSDEDGLYTGARPRAEAWLKAHPRQYWQAEE